MQITDNKILMRRWDDLHFHARQGALMILLLRELVKYCGRATLMPNTDPPILTGRQAIEYWAAVNNAVFPRKQRFQPLMVLYVTEETTPEMIDEAYEHGVRHIKVYPRFVTKGSLHGVLDYRKIIPALRRAGELGMVTLLHGEHPDRSIPGLQKSSRFFEIFRMLLGECGGKFVLEHLDTAEGVEYIANRTDGRVAATITPHHPYLTTDHVLGYNEESGFLMRPHWYCKPVAKGERDRTAIVEAATSGNPRFFYGSDGAAHLKGNKECSGCCAGLWNTHAAPSMLIKLFESKDKLHLLEDFTSRFGAEFYGIPRNSEDVAFVREDWTVPEEVPVPNMNDVIVPWMAGETLAWKVAV